MRKAIGLRQVDPLVITEPGRLIESSVPETEHAAYNAATTYTLGQRVILSHVVYESVMVGNNTGTTPGTNADKWARVSATNRHRMFDRSNQSQTTRVGSLSVRIRPGQVINTLHIANVTGARSARVRMVDPVAGTVFDTEYSLLAVLTESSWYAFFLGLRLPADEILVTNLPAYPAADVLIDLDGGTETVGVGTVIVGQAVEIGDGVRMGVRVSFADYSRQDVNKYGDMELSQGAWAKKASFPLRIPMTHVDVAYRLMVARRGLPTLWIGYEPLKCTVILGVLRSFEILIPYETFVDANVEFLGLT